MTAPPLDDTIPISRALAAEFGLLPAAIHGRFRAIIGPHWNATVTASVRSVAETFHVSTGATSRALALLVKHGYLSRWQSNEMGHRTYIYRVWYGAEGDDHDTE